MKIRTIVLVLAVFFLALATSLASDLNMGTWKINEAKSKIPAGATKNNTVVYEVSSDGVKVTVDGVDGDGKPIHNEWTGKYDGKDYPLVGDPTSTSRAYKKIDAHTTTLTNKKDGKVTTTGKIVVAADGKRRTLTVSGTDANGKKFSYAAVYDKQ
jgi:hypothetical protein